MIRRLAALATVGAAACSIQLAPAERTPTFLETEWQGETVDTIDALIQGAVLAQVIDQDGRPMVGRFITFTSLPTEDEGRPGVLLGPEGVIPNEPSVRVLSDFGGISVAQVRLGTLVGRTGIVVSVAELATQDTLYVDVLPGQLHAIALTPSDTTVTLGGSFALSWSPGDFYANAVEADVSVEATGAVTVQEAGEGATVTGMSVGSGVVRASSGSVVDSIVVQVTAVSGGA